MDSDTFLAYHRLAQATLPPSRLRLLLDLTEGDPAEIFRLPLQTLTSSSLKLTEKQVKRLQDAASAPVSQKLLATAEALGVHVVTHRDPTYPAGLLPLTDAPPLLFVRGTLLPEDRFSIAVVGSRRTTSYGREQTARFAAAFAARGLTVVSGGAAGIDTAAHIAALEAKGRTIAVIACGLDISYPADNRSLFTRIADGNGAVISEFPLETTPDPWRFPTRNRIIAGITKLTVLVETPDGSGALITARNAADYGRDVWVVPGPVDTGRSRGGHQLIQDGAALADSPEDVLAALGLGTEPAATQPTLEITVPRSRGNTSPVPSTAVPTTVVTNPERPPIPPNLTPDESSLLAHFELSPRHLDAAASAAGLSANQAAVAATLLEMKSLIRRQPGNLYVRVL